MLNYLYKRTNNYKARYQEVEKFCAGVPYDLEIGCFGSSYAKFAFDFDGFEVKGFNFGVFPQPLYYDLVLLRHYIKHFKKGAYVIFTFPPLVFALENYNNDISNYKYYKFLSKEEILNYSWKTKWFEVEYPLFRHPEKIKKIWKDDEKIFNRIFWTTSVNLDEQNQGRNAANDRAVGWCNQFGLQNLKDVEISDKICQVFRNNIKRVEEMIALCEEYQLQPVLLVPPVASCLKELFSQEFLNVFLYDNLMQVKKKSVIFLDYMNESEFNDYRLYSNADFMNCVGRKKFTKRVLRDLYADNIGILSKEECTGCSACKQICIQSAIQLQSDKEGFWYPIVNQDRCIGCKRCIKVCPTLNAIKGIKKVQEESVYAAWSNNDEVRFNSTSGGIFSEIALWALDEKIKVYGAAYDEKFYVGHIGIEDSSGLQKIRQSKYVQSDLNTIFIDIVNEIKEGKKVLFCGTPCQCKALSLILEDAGIKREKIILVDFICRGSNSPKVYQTFLKELEELYHSEVVQVWFKNKIYGWNNFSTLIEFKNGKKYLKTRSEDEYIRGYIEKNLYIRPSCMQCKHRGLNRCSDITLADFWGVKLGKNQEKSDMGTSLVILHTSRGRQIFEEIKTNIFWEEKDFKDIIEGNPCLLKSPEEGVFRKQFMEELDTLGFFKNIKRFL